ncbi:receptor-like protein kinase [Tripterygium wilfordii]|uniref:non-specific serine/threonine protein kinase n=1 Tax=Tripterygium wilfordii TaxID=458696 RepID=A0A7J7CJM7_TRIWF|nr:receptor-like protein kinase [Tripterygium wilfordii]
MKCLFIFKDKLKAKKETQSASALENQTSKSNNSALARSARSLPSPRSISELYKENEHNLRVFSIQELKEATNGFSRLLKIGEGGFGSVYKGQIKPVNGKGDPMMIAIKRLNRQGLQGHKEWLAEVKFLGIVNHPNLVKLLGYCSTDDERGIQRLLVYEFMDNKSLEDHLFNRFLPTLPWKTRLEIILGAAQGLAYLHSDLEVQVIYRDFKPSNVLLDKGFKPKLSDFGLAREGPTGDCTHVSTTVGGWDLWVADPAYIGTGHLSTHSDIWSFGVVLYEILTGRRTLERNCPTSEQKLLNWVKQFPANSKRFSKIIDPRLKNQCSINAARKIAKLADSCLNKNRKERPSMDQVVETLKQAIRDSEVGNTSLNGSTRSTGSQVLQRRPIKVV